MRPKAFIFVLSMIPIILLLLTAVQFTPPATVCKCHRCSGAGVSDIRAGFIRSIVMGSLFFQSAKIIPITDPGEVLWSAGRGVLSATRTELHSRQYRDSAIMGTEA